MRHRQHNPKVLLIAAAILTAIPVFVVTPTASACGLKCCVIHCTATECHCDLYCSSSSTGVVPSGETEVTFVSKNRALIEVKDYATMEMDQASFDCAVAVPPVQGVERVNRLSMVTKSGKPMPDYKWLANDAPSADFASLAQQAGMTSAREGWKGFVSHTEGPVVGGELYSFLIDVTLKEGTRPEDFIAALRSQGVIANGSARPDGTLDYHHYFLNAFGQGNLVVRERDSSDRKPLKPERERN